MFNKIFKAFQKTLPKMSQTEREALEAGTVWWDAELFSGNPNWDVLKDLPPLKLNEDELAFIDGPVQELCEMLDDYDINKNRKDLPPEVWDFIKDNKFFGLCIPTKYGGLGFSAYAHSEIVIKIATRSIAAAVTVMVPNSLGPAELLLNYGTTEERKQYLPNLASGKDVPCFALTGPTAGSDASSMPDVGIVGEGMWEGEKVTGLYLTFDKRYITLAPVATLMGLAIKVEDPSCMLIPSEHIRLKEGNGITVVLMPTSTPGVEIGSRHNPLDVAFMNGPITGKNVFVPMKFVLGEIGDGWRMLMECLSVGRSVSLPSLACAGGRLTSSRIGAYARLRKQFRIPIGKFEGIEEKLAMIAGNAFIMDSARKLTINAIDNLGEKPSVLSAINKYHLTEMNRQSIDAAMDIQGGAGICLGPQNFMGQIYKSIPVSITVEGANIMTRNLIIFGQGAMRCHPYVMRELETANSNNQQGFFMLMRWHIAHVAKNFFRTIKRGLFNKGINHFSSAFALTTDVVMVLLGGTLKRKERVSARLGDILSYMFMLSAIRYEKENEADVSPEVYQWAEQTLSYKTQEAFYDLYDNFPNKFLGSVLRHLVFPRGRIFSKPNDRLDHKVAQVIMQYTKERNKLTIGTFMSDNPTDKTYKLERAFSLIGTYEFLPNDLRTEVDQLQHDIIQVDDFKEL